MYVSSSRVRMFVLVFAVNLYMYCLLYSCFVMEKKKTNMSQCNKEVFDKNEWSKISSSCDLRGTKLPFCQRLLCIIIEMKQWVTFSCIRGGSAGGLWFILLGFHFGLQRITTQKKVKSEKNNGTKQRRQQEQHSTITTTTGSGMSSMIECPHSVIFIIFLVFLVSWTTPKWNHRANFIFLKNLNY